MRESPKERAECMRFRPPGAHHMETVDAIAQTLPSPPLPHLLIKETGRWETFLGMVQCK